LGGTWDAMFLANWGSHQWNFQVPTTDAMRSEFRVIQDKKIAAWLGEPWCSDGF
jgi:hypothetical protein